MVQIMAIKEHGTPASFILNAPITLNEFYSFIKRLPFGFSPNFPESLCLSSPCFYSQPLTKSSKGLSKLREHFVSIDEMIVLGKSPAQAILSMPSYMDGTAQMTS